MKNILFIAPPAGGKGTISDALVKDFNSNIILKVVIKWNGE